MMLREYRIANFKAFSHEQVIPIRPITLIYGPNSSGKSSIIQSLLLLKQTIEESEDPATLLQTKGGFTDLGGYREFLHKHDVDRTFSFGAMFDGQGEPSPLPPWLRQGPFSDVQTESFGFRTSFRYTQDAPDGTSSAIMSCHEIFEGTPETAAITYRAETLRENDRRVRRLGYGVGIRRGASERVLKASDTDYSHPYWQSVADVMVSLLKQQVPEATEAFEKAKNKVAHALAMEETDGVPNRRRRAALEREQRYRETWLKRISGFSTSEALDSIRTLNDSCVLFSRNFLPLEVGFARPESWEWEFPFSPESIAGGCLRQSYLFRRFLEKLSYVGPLRESPARQHIFSGNKPDNVGKTGKLVPDILFKNRNLLKKVNREFQRFGLGYELRIFDSPELPDVFALRLVDSTTEVNVSILDVGFGISQVLPVIVQSMLATDRTLCIEQPEIHLHPKLQAELGELLVECIAAPYKNRFIIETHSEHLILRLQRLIRSKKLSPSDISVVYVDKTSDGSKCIPLRLDEDGDFIDLWPGGFFEEGYREVFA
jgi:hypothetical protein